MFRVIVSVLLISASPLAWALDSASDEFMSGLQICRMVQRDPKAADTSLTALTWKPAHGAPVSFERHGVRVFQSPDKSACHVQTAERIDVGRLIDWMELTGALDGRVKRYAWNETRKRPLRNDVYRTWRWDSWRSASGKDVGILSHEVNVLPGATQSKPGEQAVTATISYRPRTAN